MLSYTVRRLAFIFSQAICSIQACRDGYCIPLQHQSITSALFKLSLVLKYAKSYEVPCWSCPPVCRVVCAINGWLLVPLEQRQTSLLWHSDFTHLLVQPCACLFARLVYSSYFSCSQIVIHIYFGLVLGYFWKHLPTLSLLDFLSAFLLSLTFFQAS